MNQVYGYLYYATTPQYLMSNSKDMPNKITKDVTITFHDHPKVCEEDKVIPWARC
jgi:hypothetical protein